MNKYPKIGIRPTIDGRQGGVRECLEEKTMALANAVKELIEKNLRNGDGSPVECIIADSTIGRVAESAACAEKFEREGVGSTITVTSCWCYGSETMDMNPHYPKAVWGFNGTERPGAVIWLQYWLLTHKKDCLLLVSMDTTCRIWTTTPSLPMLQKRYFVLLVLLRLWLLCVARAICRWATPVWVLLALLLMPTSSKTI